MLPRDDHRHLDTQRRQSWISRTMRTIVAVDAVGVVAHQGFA